MRRRQARFLLLEIVVCVLFCLAFLAVVYEPVLAICLVSLLVLALPFAILNLATASLSLRFLQRQNRLVLVGLIALANLYYLLLPATLDMPSRIVPPYFVVLLLIISYLWAMYGGWYAGMHLRRENDAPLLPNYECILEPERDQLEFKRAESFERRATLVCLVIQATAWLAVVIHIWRFAEYVYAVAGAQASASTFHQLADAAGIDPTPLNPVFWIYIAVLELPGWFAIFLMIKIGNRKRREWLFMLKEMEMLKPSEVLSDQSLLDVETLTKEVGGVLTYWRGDGARFHWRLLRRPRYAVGLKWRPENAHILPAELLHEFGHIHDLKCLGVLSRIVFGDPPYGDFLHSLAGDSFAEEALADDYAVKHGASRELMKKAIELNAKEGEEAQELQQKEREERDARTNELLKGFRWTFSLLMNPPFVHWYPYYGVRIRRIGEMIRGGDGRPSRK